LKEARPGYILDTFAKAMTSMQTKPYVPDSQNPRSAYYWFDGIEVGEDGGVKFYLGTKIKPYFLNLSSHFIRYKITDVAHFNKPNTWNLYEYLKEKFIDGKQKEWFVDVQILKERLGVGDKYLGRFNKFNESCLKRPVEEINNGSDIHVTYKNIKNGVSVVKIRFVVEKYKPQFIGATDLETTRDIILNALISVEYTKQNADILLEEIFQKGKEDFVVKELGRILVGANRPEVKSRSGFVTNSIKNILKGGQQSLFPNVPKHEKLTVEQCLKNRGKRCIYRTDTGLNPLYPSLCPDCRKS
jgi:hypothetical protein